MYSVSLPNKPHTLPIPGTIIANIQPVQISKSTSLTYPSLLQSHILITSFCFRSQIRIPPPPALVAHLFSFKLCTDNYKCYQLLHIPRMSRKNIEQFLL